MPEPSGAGRGARLFTAEIAYVRTLHAEVRCLGLSAEGISREARPGQFYMLIVGDGMDPLLPRAFAVHRRRLTGVQSEGQGNGLELLFQIVGQGTRALSEREAGQRIRVMGPLGRGWKPAGGSTPILVAGGMGVASLVCLAEEMEAEQRGKAKVFLGARSPDRLWCANLFEELGLTLCTAVEQGDHPFRGTVVDLLDAQEERFLGEAPSMLVCGPPAMVKKTALWAMGRGVPCQVSLEAPMACGLGVCLGCAVKRVGDGGYLRVCQEGPVVDASLVDWGVYDGVR